MKMGEYPPAIAGNGQEKGTKKQLKIVKDGTSARGGGVGGGASRGWSMELRGGVMVG
jgi:hypothetical protein